MRRSVPIASFLVAAIMIALQAMAVFAQPDDEAARAAETLKNGRLEAGSYVIRAMNDDAKPIKLHQESLLKWHNSVDKSVHGNIFVWTKNGRPEVVASIFQFYSPKVEFAAELQSLSLSPLVMEKRGEKLWSPKDPGIVLKLFDDTSAPSASKPQRLIKMRQLADQFSGRMTDWSGENYRLRLMPKPLFRYESTDADVLDGALFALTYTTDPEVLIAVEARKSGNDFRWMYGFARMNIGDLKVSYRDHEIWHADRLEDPFYYKHGVYTLFKDLPVPKTKSTAE